MKARIYKDELGNSFKILCSDGTIAEATKENLDIFLRKFLFIDQLSGTSGTWNDKSPDMFNYEKDSETYAYITDDYKLVINRFVPFDTVLKCNHCEDCLDELISVSDYAKEVGKSIEQIKVYLRHNRIPGAKKIGRDWVILKSSIHKYPTDQRINNGRYVRKKSISNNIEKS